MEKDKDRSYWEKIKRPPRPEIFMECTKLYSMNNSSDLYYYTVEKKQLEPKMKILKLFEKDNVGNKHYIAEELVKGYVKPKKKPRVSDLGYRTGLHGDADEIKKELEKLK